LVYSPLSQNLIDFLRLSDKSLSDLKFVTTPVGNIFIKKACFKNKSAIGVETSMHFYFVDDYFGGSGLLAMAKIVSALSNLPYSLSDFVSMMPKIIRAPEYSFRIKNRDFLKLYRKIYKRFLKKAKKFSYVDGISVFGDSWWFNLRPSNTQDLMRINIEAKNQSDIKKIKSLVLELIKN
jgi:phosphomannomutase